MLDWQLLESVTWRSGGTLLEAEVVAGDFAGNFIPGVARVNAYSQWEWQPTAAPLSLSVAANYRSEVYTRDDNSERAPSSISWDLGVQWEKAVQRWQIGAWVKCANLLDKKYIGAVIVNQSRGRTLEPAPGRVWNLGVSLSHQW